MAEEFNINSKYAENYDKWRNKEELQKLESKYGDIEDQVSSSDSSESEDSDAEGLTAALEKGWLRTLAALKSKDPKIYKKEQVFYSKDEGDIKPSSSKTKAPKVVPMFIKDYERKLILEKGGQLSDSEEDEIQHGPSYYDEQEALKTSFKTAADQLIDADADAENLLVKRVKSAKEIEKEEADYVEWIKGQKEDLGSDEKEELEPLKKYWNNPGLDEGERFLRDYFLNKRYMENDDDQIPTYDEIVADEEDMEEEEELLGKQEEFERKYNFRYEEPDAEFIKKYPRSVEDSMRRKDTTRAKKRDEVKERKLREKTKQKEEILQLKKFKKQEIMDKVEHLKEISGDATMGFDIKDMEGDFDPAEYDRRMTELFDKGYYEKEGEEQKPMWDDDELVGIEKNWDAWDGEKEEQVEGLEEDETEGQVCTDEVDEIHEPHCDDLDFNMDADFDPNEDKSFGKSKKKKKSKFAKALMKKKPAFNPSDKTFEEYYNEYYALEFEDIVASQPVRFKYRTVKPNDFGLSVNEVLQAQDRELNSWVSVKRMSQYRDEKDEEYDVKAYQIKASIDKKKMKLLPSLYTKKEDEGDAGSSKGSKKRRKRKMNETGEKTDTDVSISNVIEPEEKKQNKELNDDTEKTIVDSSKNEQKRKKKKKKQKPSVSVDSHDDDKDLKPSAISSHSNISDSNTSNKPKKKKKFKKEQTVISDERLKAYGINPKKFKFPKKSK